MSIWGDIESGAEKVGSSLVKGASWCASNPTCKANAEKYGTQAAVAIANKVALQELSFWDSLKSDAEKAGEGLLHGAEWCASNATCKANAEKYGTKAAVAIANKVSLQELSFWDSLKSDAEKAGEGLLHGAEWCASNATCKANAEKYGTKAAVAIANKVSLQELNFWDSLKSDAEKAGEGLLHGAEWCASNATCKANAEKYGT
jgi:hypothetical protein